MKCKKILAFVLFTFALTAFAETGMGRHKKVYAVPTPGKVVIDGKLDDWDLSPQIEMFVMSETREQMNAKFSLMYDEEALYVSGVKRDNTPMLNRNDPKVRGDFGWDADSCQIRFSIDADDGYPISYTTWGPTEAEKGDGKVAHLILWYYTDEKLPCLQMMHGMNYKVVPPATEPFGIIPNDMFEAAYVMWEDGKGYTFEYKIPWTTLGAKRSFKGGDLMAGAVQYNWGAADGISHDGIVPVYDVYVPGGLPYQNTHCWGKIIFSEKGNIDKALVEEGVKPERPLPLTFTYTLPESGNASIVLFDKNNTAVRIVTASSPRQAGEISDSWDGMDQNGNPLPAGTYTWKGVVHQPLTVKALLSVHNSGQPGYLTDDKSSSWGADHACPTTVCPIPDGMLLVWEDTEAGSAIIRTDLNGRKKWGMKVGASHVATDGERFFSIITGNFPERNMIRGYSLEDTRPLNFGNGKPDLEAPAGAEGIIPTGLAYAEGKLYAAYGESGVIGIFDSVSGDLQGTMKASGSVWTLAWDAAGNRLLAVVAKAPTVESTGEALGKAEVFKKAANLPAMSHTIPSGLEAEIVAFSMAVEGNRGPSKVIDSPLDTPTGLAVDKDGNIYVANQGALQNVSVFSKDGKFTHSIGKVGGRPARGLYEQGGMYMPGGIGIAADGRLWVAETKDSPRRHSVWQTDGAFSAEFFGGCSYNGWVWMDTADPKHVYSHNVKWEIDLDKGTWKPISTIWRATQPNEVREIDPGGYLGHIRVITAKNGKRYAFGMSEAAPKFYREDGELFKPFAGVLRIVRPGGYQPSGMGYPTIYDNPEKYPDGMYMWQDKNNDGLIQEDEIYRYEPNHHSTGLFSWLDKDLNIWGGIGSKLVPTHIDGNGQPHYDYDKRTPSPARGNFVYLGNPDETEIYSFSEGEQMFARWNADGTPMWAYRNLVSWPASMSWPIVTSGRLHGLTQPIDAAGEFTGVVSYFCPYHIWTTDGIYVTALMRDFRDGKGAGEDIIATESSQGQLVKLNIEGKERYFLLGGANDGRITEIFGLDTVKRLSGGTYVHTPEMAETAVKAVQDYNTLIAKSKKFEIQRGRSALENAVAVERTVDDKRRFAVQSTYDAKNIYFRYDVQTEIGLVNSQPDGRYLFKGGNCIDVQIATMPVDGNREPSMAIEHCRPIRLLVTRQDGKPTATLYRKTVDGEKNPFTFTSPTGEETFDLIEDVSDKVMLDYREQPGGFVAVVTVPQDLVGLALKPSQELTLDVGYLFGNKEGTETTARAYWNNSGFAASVLFDVPNESRLVPEEWGTAVVE